MLVLGRLSGLSRVGRLTRRRGVKQFAKFLIVGASGAVVNVAVFTVLQHATPLDAQRTAYDLNFSVAFLSGAISNYFLNRMWTFRSSGHAGIQSAKFIAVSCLALVVGLGVSALVTPTLGPGHRTWLVATLSGVAINFFINKYWTFREPA